jgi:HTH-type transcriptional regulator, sugar sensing transcriptional regulator
MRPCLLIKMNTKVLQEIGLTESQIKVYLSLLELGLTKSGKIINKTSLASSAVYRALEELIEKGLVSFVIQSKIKYFQATDPNNILKLWDDKKLKLNNLIPELKESYKISPKTETKMYVGWKGVQNAFNYILEILPEGSDYIAFTSATSEKSPKHAKIFFYNFQQKRLEKKYKVKLIANSYEKQIFQKRFKDLPNLRIKYVKGFAPKGIAIFEDNLLITSFEEEKPTAVIINSKEIANSFREMFYSMWEIATI